LAKGEKARGKKRRPRDHGYRDRQDRQPKKPDPRGERKRVEEETQKKTDSSFVDKWSNNPHTLAGGRVPPQKRMYQKKKDKRKAWGKPPTVQTMSKKGPCRGGETPKRRKMKKPGT